MLGALHNKIAIATGAGSGIGRATSLLLAQEGATVEVSNIGASSAEETLFAIKHPNGDSVAVPADVSKPSDVQRLIAQGLDTYGRLDCASNNVGV